jgi:hypothetical protein
MALAFVIKNESDIPENLKTEYEKGTDGFYHLQLDEKVVPKTRLDEFRDNNIRLSKDFEDYKKKFGDIDPDEYRELKKQAETNRHKKLIDEGKIDQLVSERTETLRSNFEGKIKKLSEDHDSLKSERNTLYTKLEDTLITSRIRDAALEVGVPKKGAMKHIVSAAKGIWILRDGEPVPVDSKGDVIYGEDGKSPLTFKEQMQGLMVTEALLFEPSSGGGTKKFNKGDQNRRPGDGSENLSPVERLKIARRKK